MEEKAVVLTPGHQMKWLSGTQAWASHYSRLLQNHNRAIQRSFISKNSDHNVSDMFSKPWRRAGFFYFFNERMKEIANEVKINQEMHISATFIL